jgi:hypothetical protein
MNFDITVVMLSLSVTLVLVGNFLRTLRWKYLIGSHAEVEVADLVRPLSFGYLANSVIPYKLGEVLRGLLAGVGQDQNTKARIWASIIAERVLDVFSLFVVFVLGFSFMQFTNSTSGSEIKSLITQYLFFSVVIASTLLSSLSWSSKVKLVILKLSKFLDPKLQNQFLLVFFFTIEQVKSLPKFLRKFNFLLLTILMWISYLSGYYFLGKYLSISNPSIDYSTIVSGLFNLLELTRSPISNLWEISLYKTIVLFSIPSFIAILIPKSWWLKLSEHVKYFYQNENKSMTFANWKEQLKFLTFYFQGKNRDIAKAYYELNYGIEIVQDCSGMSGAITVLAKRDGALFYRKYGIGEMNSEKIESQERFLRSGDSGYFAKILDSKAQDLISSYDMEYHSDSRSMFEFIHTYKDEETSFFFSKLIHLLNHGLFVSVDFEKEAKALILFNYYNQKILPNLIYFAEIAAKNNIDMEKGIVINSREYPSINSLLAELRKMNWVDKLNVGPWAYIHGDLTLENIIYSPNRDHNFYLIDPNPSQEPFPKVSDYSKLLQSLKYGFEFRHMNSVQSIHQNNFRFTFLRSKQYESICNNLQKFLSELGKDFSISSEFHLAVHMLRLLKYSEEFQTQMFLLTFMQLNELTALEKF